MSDKKPADGAIQQIRDIVFGKEMQSYEKRFSTIEDRFDGQILELHSLVEESRSEMSSNLNENFEVLSGQIHELKELMEALGDELKESKKQARSEMSSLEAASLSKIQFANALDMISTQVRSDVSELGSKINHAPVPQELS